MTKFIKTLSSFFSVFFLSALLLFIVVSSLHKFLPSKLYYSEEFNNAFEQKNAQLIAIGNSKLLSSIDVSVLQDELSLNSALLGYSSSNISISKLALEAYINKCTTKPKIVLLEVSWFTFNKNRTYFHSISGDLLLEDISLLKYTPEYYPQIIDNLTTSIKKQLVSYIIPPKAKDYSSKFTKKSPNSKDYTFNVKDFETVFRNHKADVDASLLSDFYSIVSLCKKHNIKLILYTAPEDEEYSKLQTDIAKIKHIFRSVAKTNNNTEYLDYSFGGRLYDKQFENWLLDSHHINENDLFTKKLTHDINSLQLGNL